MLGISRSTTADSNTVINGIAAIINAAWLADVLWSPALSKTGQTAKLNKPEIKSKNCDFPLEGNRMRKPPAIDKAIAPAKTDLIKPTLNPSICATTNLFAIAVPLQKIIAARAAVIESRLFPRACSLCLPKDHKEFSFVTTC